MKDIMKTAKNTLVIESDSIKYQINHIDGMFVKAVEYISKCTGRLVVMGIGKSGLIGRKIAATMSSLGIPSVFAHPAECLHGDLGMLMPNDLVLMLSYTGESEEIKKVILAIKHLDIPIIAMTGKPNSSTWSKTDIVINTRVKKEACHFNLAPTASTTAMLAMGDALALCSSEKKGFKKEHLAKFHPGGGIGKQLTVKVKDIMRKGRENPVISENKLVNDVLFVMTRTRLGAANIVDKSGRLSGFFTDGDLRRKSQKDKTLFNKRLSDVMTRSPLTIEPDMLASDAAALLRTRKVDNIPVVDAKNRPIGVLDAQDLIREGIV
jgi:arabinose-5-phosphate isomerase